MAYVYIDNKIGVPDITTVSSTGLVGAPWTGTSTVTSPNTGDLPSVTCWAQPGMIVDAWDTTLGVAKFILLAIPTSTTITAGLLYQWDKNYNVVVVPVGSSSKNTGVAVAAAYTAATSSTTLVQYGWFCIQGQVAVLKTAVSASPQQPVFMSATAGRVYFTSSAGKGIIGARTQNTATVSAGVSTVNVYLNFSALESA